MLMMSGHRRSVALVKLTKISYAGKLFKVWLMQDFGLFRVMFRQVSLY
jgi:hypothetical protein